MRIDSSGNTMVGLLQLKQDLLLVAQQPLQLIVLFAELVTMPTEVMLFYR
jgi:hypothetical protein